MSVDEAKQLSPNEINRVIAEALYPRFCDGEPPDYFHDLNSCHEAEKELEKGFSERSQYYPLVASMVELNNHYYCFTAPANIRAIALAVVLSERKK